VAPSGRRGAEERKGAAGDGGAHPAARRSAGGSGANRGNGPEGRAREGEAGNTHREGTHHQRGGSGVQATTAERARRRVGRGQSTARAEQGSQQAQGREPRQKSERRGPPRTGARWPQKNGTEGQRSEERGGPRASGEVGRAARFGAPREHGAGQRGEARRTKAGRGPPRAGAKRVRGRHARRAGRESPHNVQRQHKHLRKSAPVEHLAKKEAQACAF